MPDRSIRNSLSSLKLDIAVAALKSSFGYRKFAKKFNRCTAMSEVNITGSGLWADVSRAK
jgi:hypothetical protein